MEIEDEETLVGVVLPYGIECRSGAGVRDIIGLVIKLINLEACSPELRSLMESCSALEANINEMPDTHTELMACGEVCDLNEPAPQMTKKEYGMSLTKKKKRDLYVADYSMIKPYKPMPHKNRKYC